MRKTLLLVLLLFAGRGIYAQTGAVTIDNSANAYAIDVYMYGHDAGYFGGAYGACNEIITKVITVQAGAMMYINDECTMQKAYGWIASPGTYICPLSTYSLVWTHTRIYVVGASCAYASGLYLTDDVVGCESSPPYTLSTFTVSNTCNFATWTRLGSAPGGVGDDILITVW